MGKEKKQAFVFLKVCRSIAQCPICLCSGVHFPTTHIVSKLQSLVFQDPDYAWIPAKLVRSSGNVADVQIPEYADEQATVCDGGKKAKNWIEAEVDLSDYNKGVLPMQNVDENGNLRKFADMVELPFLHEVRKTATRFCW